MKKSEIIHGYDLQVRRSKETVRSAFTPSEPNIVDLLNIKSDVKLQETVRDEASLGLKQQYGTRPRRQNDFRSFVVPR